jgi:hypothetical protein
VTKSRSRGFVVLAWAIASGCSGWLSGTESNVPSSRLTAEEYTSPDSEYRVRIPPLVHPGARIDETVGAAGQRAVGFIDDFGRFYVIQCAHRASPDVTLDSMASTSTAGVVVKERQVVETRLGRELRILGFHERGSPMIRRTNQAGTTVEKRMDVVEAWTFFVTKDLEFRIAAGITVLEGVDRDTLFPKAKQQLDEFVAGLTPRGESHS